MSCSIYIAVKHVGIGHMNIRTQELSIIRRKLKSGLINRYGFDG